MTGSGTNSCNESKHCTITTIASIDTNAVISLALTTAVRKGSPSSKFGPSCVASEGIENGGLCCPCRLPGTRLTVGMATLWQ